MTCSVYISHPTYVLIFSSDLYNIPNSQLMISVYFKHRKPVRGIVSSNWTKIYFKAFLLFVQHFCESETVVTEIKHFEKLPDTQGVMK